MAADAPTPPDPRGAATPGPWRLQPFYDSRIADGPVRNRYAGLYQPVPGQALGSLSCVLTVGIKGPVDDCWLNVSDADARLIEQAWTIPALRDALAGAEAALQSMIIAFGDRDWLSFPKASALLDAKAARDAARLALASAEGGVA